MSKEEKQKKPIHGNAMVTFCVTYVTKPDVTLEEFINKSTEWMGEPKNADGTVISMTPKTIAPIQRGKIKEIKSISNQSQELSDKLDKYMHFSFHGTRFVVDRENMSVQCDKIAKFDEMTGEKKGDLWSLNVETSN